MTEVYDTWFQREFRTCEHGGVYHYCVRELRVVQVRSTRSPPTPRRSCCWPVRRGQGRSRFRRCVSRKATALRRPQAKRGEDGFDGLDGCDGQDGVSGREVVNTAPQPSENAVITAQADCPGTQKVVGGGAIPPTVEGAELQLSMTAQLDDNTWHATVTRVGGT
jgi:hypothetical protein